MKRISWVSLMAGAGIGAAMAYTTYLRKDQQYATDDEKEDVEIKSIATKFLQELE